MKNKGLIITGLIVFFVIATIPFWYNVFSGTKAKTPELVYTDKAKEAKVCVESTDYMKTEHMQLLDLWRDAVVRKAERAYVNSSGKTFDMSLTNTCLDCHANKAEFCDRCHNYSSVRPYCWDCHNTKENN
ncbi:sulfate reduction electron transfer complex DsrMKJOP subunit DsrJ [Desulfosudis oleivorans]|uniref:Cytochrome c family protein n=1 Tax=Desulfosudis oleivorans (strain DSM 6200 / JCM 39069 / Hxd3) TaxID=96561 RepID=A8ZTJ8_DESOH|nr:sulfate reduction electron transfer complex DsrMKJOP subunit DsrJ [Desulfosudis oleivorans]ABW66262.1 cytochrome c family protein [Desulfosudis oleivorans Hxd3]